MDKICGVQAKNMNSKYLSIVGSIYQLDEEKIMELSSMKTIVKISLKKDVKLQKYNLG